MKTQLTNGPETGETKTWDEILPGTDNGSFCLKRRMPRGVIFLGISPAMFPLVNRAKRRLAGGKQPANRTNPTHNQGN